MLPATKLDNPPPRRAAFRPAVIRGTRPVLNIVKLEGAMMALEGYVDCHLAAVEGAELAPSIFDDELDPRLEVA
jgi:hypothetical protein